MTIGVFRWGFELLSLPAVSLLRHTVAAVLLGVTLKRHNRLSEHKLAKQIH